MALLYQCDRCLITKTTPAEIREVDVDRHYMLCLPCFANVVAYIQPLLDTEDSV